MLANVLAWLLVAVPQGSAVGGPTIVVAEYASQTACAQGAEFQRDTGLYPRMTLLCVPKER